MNSIKVHIKNRRLNGANTSSVILGPIQSDMGASQTDELPIILQALSAQGGQAVRGFDYVFNDIPLEDGHGFPYLLDFKMS